MKKLTKKQAAILRWIISHINRRGYIPTIREIAEHFGITNKGAFDHCISIRKKGYLRNPGVDGNGTNRAQMIPIRNARGVPVRIRIVEEAPKCQS